MSQIVERFASAVQALVGDGPIKNRLMQAYTGYLEDLQQVDLPVSGKREFTDLHSALHRAKAVGSIDCVQASVQKMSPEEAGTYARTIVKLYSELLAMEQPGKSDSSLRLATEAPPRFLVTGGH